jgi:ZIP family zinc transporter
MGHDPPVLAAATWAFVGACSLVVGAAVGLRWRVRSRVVGLVMGFGAGTLISAVAYDLVRPAYLEAGRWATLVGLLAGALVFMGGDIGLDRWARRREQLADAAAPPDDPGVPALLPGEERETNVSGAQLALGALLDGVPESVAIGITLLTGSGTVSVAMVAAVFLSNVPEGLSATVGLRAEGRSTGFVLGLWSAVVAVSTVAAAIGYQVLGAASPDVIAAVQAFAAGAILTMLANTMMPEAYGNGGRAVGLVTVLGFVAAAGLATVGG